MDIKIDAEADIRLQTAMFNNARLPAVEHNNVDNLCSVTYNECACLHDIWLLLLTCRSPAPVTSVILLHSFPVHHERINGGQLKRKHR